MIPYHVARIYPKRYLFLKKVDPTTFQWFEEENATACVAKTPAKAVLEGSKLWQDAYFRTLNCGFRYTLPERDEVGCNAFFWQMTQSYAASNGQYFDEELGHLCYVDFASDEALEMWRKLR